VDAAKVHYPTNSNDNIDNRELKAEYSGVNSLLTGLKPDPKRHDGDSSTTEKNGLFTTREEGSDGKWREYTYNADRTKITYKDSTGREYYKDGDTLVYKNTNSGAEALFGISPDGDVYKAAKDASGNTSTKVARANGSYNEYDGAGKITKNTAADPNMAKYEELAGKVGAGIGPDGTTQALTDEQRYSLATALGRYDLETLNNFDKSGMKIRLVDDENPPPGGYPGGRTEWLEGGLGYYTKSQKTVVLKQSDFQNGGNIVGVDTLHHELGHAVDDMLTPDSATGQVREFTESDPRLNQMFEDYKTRTQDDPSKTWSGYAKTNPQEYFAEGVMKYLGGDKQKAQLQNMDPALYAYVEEMLNKSKDGNLPNNQVEKPAYPTFPGGGFPGGGFPTFPGGGFPGGGFPGGGFPTFPGGGFPGGGFPTFPGGGFPGGGFPPFGNNPIFPPTQLPFQPGPGMDPQGIMQQMMMMRMMQMMQQMMMMMMFMSMMGNPMGMGMMPMMMF
jgi:hypothetical protein